LDICIRAERIPFYESSQTQTVPAFEGIIGKELRKGAAAYVKVPELSIALLVPKVVSKLSAN
jgi:hypothetical protein